MPTSVTIYSRDEVADLVRRHYQDLAGHPVSASMVSIKEDGSIHITTKMQRRKAQ